MKIVAFILICHLLIIPLTPVQAQPPREITYDETVTATLLDQEGHHEWEFEGIAGDIVVITVHSEDFASVLELRDIDRDPYLENRSPRGENARLITLLPNHGRYAIYVGADDAAIGDYTLSLDKYDLSDNGEIHYGETHFSLKSTIADPTWQFDGRRGDVVSIAVNSHAFDTRISLIAPDGGTINADDDSGSNLNAFMVTMLPADGRYSIVVHSFGGESGLYFITLDSVTEDEILTYGDTIEGDIWLGGQVYIFEAQQDDVVLMSVESTAFDPTMSVQDTNGLPLVIDDDSGAGHNPQIIVPILSNGLYLIVVQPFALDQSGSFSVTLDQVSLSDPTHLAMGDVVHAGNTDLAEATWTFDGTVGTAIDIRITSYSYDTTLGLISPDDNIIATDRNRGTANTAQISTILPTDGQYSILIRTLSLTGTLGPYTISLQPAIVDTAVLQGGDVMGSLGGETNMYAVDGRQGQNISVSVESETFDPIVDIYGPDGNLFTSDDDSGEGLNALIDTPLFADGVYIVVVRAIDERNVGDYWLRVTVVE